MTITSEFNVWDNVYCMQNNKPVACVIVAVHFPTVYHNISDLDSMVEYKLLTKEEYDWRKDNSVAASNDEGAFIVPACMVASSAKELLLRMLNEYDKKETNVKWYVAIDNYGIYESTMSQVPIFHKGEMTTKEKVYTYFPNITDEEFNKHFRPATKEDIQKYALENPLVGEFDFPDYDKPATEEDIPLKKIPVEVYQASVDSATKEPEQPKDEIPQKTKFKVGDHIKSDVLTPRKGVVTKVNNGWYILDGRYILNFEYEDNWELVESKPEPKKCLFTKDLYTDGERKELCEGCQEECELNKDIEPKERKVSSVLKNMLDNINEESLEKTREEMQKTPEIAEFDKAIETLIGNIDGDYCVHISSYDDYINKFAPKILAAARKLIASEIDATQMTRELRIKELHSLTLGAAYYQGIVNTIKKIKGE